MGPQTATVVGRAGEEIYTDKFGRIKVQFHWDRQGKKNQNSSCWIRVGQLAAGAGWGAMFIPRVGQEVLVEFQDGDPDRPIVTGTLYNAEHMPFHALAEGTGERNKTRSGFVSRSSKRGQREHYSELRFDDTLNKEMLYLHAQRDFDSVIERTFRTSVGKDKHVSVTGNSHEKVDKTLHSSVGEDLVSSVGKTLFLQIGEDYVVNVSNGMLLKAGSSVQIAAGTSVVIKAAGGFIAIGPEGVTIEGTMVKINSGGVAQASPLESKSKSLKLPNDATGESS